MPKDPFDDWFRETHGGVDAPEEDEDDVDNCP